MRERGLKLDGFSDLVDLFVSLPMRERGLKLQLIAQLFKLILSLPMRERGLKLSSPDLPWKHLPVAPHAGAWIETLSDGYGGLADTGRSPCGSVD